MRMAMDFPIGGIKMKGMTEFWMLMIQDKEAHSTITSVATHFGGF